jgi:hypothetical protein
MARSETNVQPVVSFVKGLVTEATELTYPENASADELNCVLNKKGNRTRRLGIDYEASHVETALNLTTTEKEDDAYTVGLWKSVAGDGNRNFVVVQYGSTLSFYDASTVPLSNGIKSFTVNLATYAAPAASNVNLTQVSMISGKGFLFVASEKLDPFYVTYSVSGDSISETSCSIRIRDMDGVDDGVDVENEAATLPSNNLHKYNLYNQGWYIDNVRLQGGTYGDPLTKFFNQNAVYPANKHVWWLMKDSSDEFNGLWREIIPRGSTHAPKGHYILNPFLKDRDAASGLTTIPDEAVTERPRTVSFYAGRVWYAGQKGVNINDQIFFSQIVEDNGLNIGKCYQRNDPTNEGLNSLLANDGGVIVIPDIGNILRMVPYQSALLIVATNGVWAVSGTDGGFASDDFKVSKLSSVDAIGVNSFVDVEGVPMWWSTHGIMTVEIDEGTGNPVVRSITDQTIKTYYSDIPVLCRQYATGTYDPINRAVRWLFNTTAPTTDDDRFVYNRVLNLDLDLGAFYPYSITDLAANSPVVVGTVAIPATSATSELVKYLTILLDGATYELTFSEFNNTSYLDWYTEDTAGIGYSSYLITGHELFGDIARFKQAPYIYTYLKDNDDFTNYSMYLQGRWDFSTSGDSGKYTTKFQTYRDVGNTNTAVLVTRHKFRGKGKSLQLHFTSDAQEKFDILGWALVAQGNTQV